jgi:hypothetical protein
VTSVTKVVLVIAMRAITVNKVVMKSVEIGRMPCSTTSSSATSEPASWSVGTVSAAAIETST